MRLYAAKDEIMLMSAEACGAKALELDIKADECRHAGAADLYRTLADQWRFLRIEAIAEAAVVAKGRHIHPASRV